MSDATFNWKSKSLVTLGDLMDALHKLENEEEAKEFVRQYKLFIAEIQDIKPSEAEKGAVSDIGYIIGYSDPETAQRLYKLTHTAHPIALM